MNILLALILAFIAPLILLPVEQVLPYPYVIEEIVKLLSIILIILYTKQTKKNYWLAACCVGILFTISESSLYLINFLSSGQLFLFPIRLLVTGVLHAGTSTLLYGVGRKNWFLLIFGLIIAICIHYYYNQIISGLQ